jgi:uncharacterized SAM-binding protein YcdF (DUF218 family)
MRPKTLEEYERSLEIARESEVPPLSPDEVAEITRTVFCKDEVGPADLFFLFGTYQGDWGRFSAIWREVGRPPVLVAGQIGPDWFKSGKPLAHHMRDHLVAHGVPEAAILVEDRSTNTKEDVERSLPILEAAGVRPGRILFAAKAHHSGRCLRTLRKFFPHAYLMPLTFPARYGDVFVTARDWNEHDVARARVYGEYLRIKVYAGRGDIAE